MNKKIVKKGQIWIHKVMCEYKLLIIKTKKEEIEVKFFSKGSKSITDTITKNYVLANYKIQEKKA